MLSCCWKKLRSPIFSSLQQSGAEVVTDNWRCAVVHRGSPPLSPSPTPSPSKTTLKWHPATFTPRLYALIDSILYENPMPHFFKPILCINSYTDYRCIYYGGHWESIKTQIFENTVNPKYLTSSSKNTSVENTFGLGRAHTSPIRTYIPRNCWLLPALFGCPEWTHAVRDESFSHDDKIPEHVRNRPSCTAPLLSGTDLCDSSCLPSKSLLHLLGPFSFLQVGGSIWNVLLDNLCPLVEALEPERNSFMNYFEEKQLHISNFS